MSVRLSVCLPFTNRALPPNCLSYRNGTDLFGIVLTSWFEPWAPPWGPKPKIVTFGLTINCHTIFPLKISPEIQWPYSYTYTGDPEATQGAQQPKKHKTEYYRFLGPLGPLGVPV